MPAVTFLSLFTVVKTLSNCIYALNVLCYRILLNKSYFFRQAVVKLVSISCKTSIIACVESQVF